MSNRLAPKRCSPAGDSLREFAADRLPASGPGMLKSSLNRSSTNGPKPGVSRGWAGSISTACGFSGAAQGKFLTFGVTRGCIEVASPVSSITLVIPP